MKMYRHGDLLLVEIAELPKNLIERNTQILAEGEVTGHNHAFAKPVKIYDVDELSDKEITSRFVDIIEANPLTHPEHKTLTIEPGKYKVIREREFDYFTEEIRRVAD